MILLAIFHCKGEKASKFTEGVRKENSVVSKSNARQDTRNKIDTQLGLLSCGELVVIASL